MSILDDFADTISSPFEDLADTVSDGIDWMVQAIEDTGMTLGEGIADAALTVGNGIVTFGRGAGRWTVSATGTVVDFVETSAGEVADWTATAAGDIAAFSADAFEAVCDVAVEAWKAIESLFTERLPELDAPCDEARVVAETLFPGLAQGLAAAARAGNLTMGYKVSASAGVGVGAKAHTGLYVDSGGDWGFFKATVHAARATGAAVDVDVIIVFGGRDRFSGTSIAHFGVQANFGSFKAGAEVLLRAGDFSFLGFQVGAGITAKMPSGDPKINKTDPNKFKLAITHNTADPFRAISADASHWDAAVRVASGVGARDRVLATAQAAAYKLFEPIVYGELRLATDLGAPLYLEHGTDLTYYAGAPYGGAEGPIVLRVVAGLSDPKGVSLELPGTPPRYLAEQGDWIAVKPWQDSDSFRKSATFVLERGLSNPHDLSFATASDPNRYLSGETFQVSGYGATPEAPLRVLPRPADASDEWKRRATFHVVPAAVPVPQSAVLRAGETLRAGEFRRSPNGRYIMALTPEGRLMVAAGTSANHVTGWWRSGTPPPAGTGAAVPSEARLEADGDLVVRRIDNGVELYRSGVYRGDAADRPTEHFLAVTNAGVLGTFQGTPDRPGELIWTTLPTPQAIHWVRRRKSVALQIGDQLFLTADNGGTDAGEPPRRLRVDAPFVGRHEIFEWCELHDGSVAIRSYKRQYLSSRANQGQEDVEIYLEEIHDKCKYRVEPQPDGSVVLLDCDGGRLYRGDQGQVIAQGGPPAAPLKIRVIELTIDPTVHSERAFTLQAVHSGQFVDVEGRSHENGARLVQRPESGGLSQQWHIHYHDDGYFSLVSALSNLVMDVWGINTADGTPVNQGTANGGPNQRFKLLPREDGTFVLVARHSNKAVDSTGGSTPGGPLVQWSVHYGHNQRFRLRLALPPAPSVVPLAVLVHVQNHGDLHFADDQRAGMPGTLLRIEGLQLTVVDDSAAPGLGLEIMGHVQNVGDTPWQPASTFLGTRGKGLRLEGFAVRLTGPDLVKTMYSVNYRAGVIRVGLPTRVVVTGDHADGEFCGTRGQGRPLEWVQVWITRRPAA